MNRQARIRRNIRNFFLISCTLLLVIVLLSTLLYSYFSDVLTKTAYNDAMSSMVQANTSANIMLDNTTNFTTEMLNDPTLSSVLCRKPSIYNISLALNRLSSFAILIPYVDSVYLFNRECQTVFLSASRSSAVYGNQVLPFDIFPDHDAMERFNTLPSSDVSISLRTFQLEGSSQHLVNYSVLTGNGQKWLSHPSYAIMINISSDYLDSMMQPILERFPQSQMALYSNGSWCSVSSTDSENTLHQLSAELSPEEILNGGKVSGYCLSSLDGEKYLLLYVANAEYGWINYMAIPYRVLVAPASKLFKYTLLIALIVLTVSAICAIILTRHYSKSLDKTEEQMVLLSQHLDNSQLAVRQNLLYNLLQNPADDQSVDKLRSIDPMDRPVTANGWYNVSIISIDDYVQQMAEHPDRKQISFMSEVAAGFKQVMPSSIRCSSLLLLSRCIVFISSSEDMSQEEQLAGYLHQGQQSAIANHLSVSVLMGANAYDVRALHAVYAQVTSMRRQLIYYGRGSFVRMTTVSQTEPQQSYVYPEASEKRLSNEILKGNSETAFEAYLEIITSAKNHSFAAFESAVGHLNIMLTAISRKIAGGGSTAISCKELELDQFDSVEALNEGFRARIELLAQNVSLHKSASRDRLVATVDQYVEEHYSDSTLGIEAIADALNRSANYIGRTYKQATTFTILDKLLEVRMIHARDLLANSNLSVSAIAANVGFASDSYFYKMFKEECLMTPAEYRAKMQNIPEQQVSSR